MKAFRFPLLLATLSSTLAAPAMANEYSAMWLAFDRAQQIGGIDLSRNVPDLGQHRPSGDYEAARTVLVNEVAQAGVQAGASEQAAQDIRNRSLWQLYLLDSAAQRQDRVENDLEEMVALYTGKTPPTDRLLKQLPFRRLEILYATKSDNEKAAAVLQKELASTAPQLRTETNRLYCLRWLARYQLSRSNFDEARELYAQMLPLISSRNEPRADTRIELYFEYKSLLKSPQDDKLIQELRTRINQTRDEELAAQHGAKPPAEEDTRRAAVAAAKNGEALAPLDGVGSADAVIANPEQCQPHYPEGAGPLGLRGTVVVRAMLDDGGAVSSVAIAQSSGWYSLDETTREAISHCRFTAPVAGEKLKRRVLALTYDWKPE